MLLILVIINLQLVAQTQIISKDIADIVQPNTEVELFYGNAQYSADKIVILPKYIIIYDAFTTTFHLLDKETRLNLDNLCLFDIEHINTHNVSYIDEKGKTFLVLRTPFNNYTTINKIDMHTLSDTSFYGGLIRIKKYYKILKLYVENQKLKTILINYNPKTDYKSLTKNEKRKQKLKFNKHNTINFSNYFETKNYAFITPRSPYVHQKRVKFKTQKNTYRDSLFYFNCIYYRKQNTDSLKLLYRNSYNEISKLLEYDEFGFYTGSKIITANNNLIYYSEILDSLIIFDNNLKRIFTTNIKTHIIDFFKEKTSISKEKWSYIKIHKDEFTDKLYIYFIGINGSYIISELNFNYTTQKPIFKFLREYKVNNAKEEVVAINKGILYISTTNSLVGNKYVYQYDLYKGLNNKDKLLEINFAKVKSQNQEKNKSRYWIDSKTLDKYNKSDILTNKQIKKYFGKLKKDTANFNQNTQLNTIKSILKCIKNDTIVYALSQLFVYKGNAKLDIQDDMKAKNYLYFKSLLEEYNKERTLELYNSVLNEFNEAEKELYNKNKIAIKTPSGLFIYMFKINGLWYMDSAVQIIETSIE